MSAPLPTLRSPVTRYRSDLPPSASTLERFTPRPARRFGRVRLRHPEPGEFTATRIVWSAGDDGEHAWFWEAENAKGRTLTCGYMHERDEDAVIKECGEAGADVAEDAVWEEKK